MNNLFNMNGKKAIFIGASGGLGRGMVEGFLDASAEVVMLGTSPKSAKIAEEYRAKGRNSHGI